MLYGDRQDQRQIFFDAWRKHQTSETLTPLEQQVVNILLKHPEYHSIFNDAERYLEKDFIPQVGEANPFLHISLHLSITEQLSLDKPKGIRKLYQDMVQRFGDIHEAEHGIMNSLAIEIYEMTQKRQAFNEKAYLKRIKKTIRDGYWG